MPLGQRRVWKGTGTKRRCVSKEDHMMYVPILETLQSLLRNKIVVSEVCMHACVHI